jgi:hypothetical protein
MSGLRLGDEFVLFDEGKLSVRSSAISVVR